MVTQFVIDLSPIAYQIINRITGYGGNKIKHILDSGRKYLTEESEQLKFLQDLHNEIKDTNKYFSILGVKSTYLAFDSLEDKSYRFSVYPDYKNTKNRNKEQVYDKKIFKSLIARYYNDLVDNGFKVIHVPTLEADDLIYEFTKMIPESENVGIVTSDGDMDQLLSDRVFILNPIMQFTKVSGNFRKSGFINDDKEDPFSNFFSEISNIENSEGYDRFFNNSKVINPIYSLVEKIIVGDTNDNIPSMFYYKTKKGDKEFGFTDKRFNQLLEKFPTLINTDFFHDEEKLYKLVEAMYDVVGRDFDLNNIRKIRESLSFNRKMIDLNESKKYHGMSSEVLGAIQDQIRKPNVDFDIIKYTDEVVKEY